MSNKTEIKKYEIKLSNLLDGLVFFTDKTDNKEHTPRSYFEDNFKKLVETPFMYFKNISIENDNSVADFELKEFIVYGGAAKGAYKHVEREIYELIGWTLDFIESNESSSTINNYKALHEYGANEYTSHVVANNLLSLEAGLELELNTVREWLSYPYSADTPSTVREVLTKESKDAKY